MAMFDDMPADESWEVDSSSSDRELLYSIWRCNEVGDLPADEAWAILFERHPTQWRFLLLNAREELLQPGIAGVWTPTYFAGKLTRILDNDATLEAQVRDVVTVASSAIKREKHVTVRKLLERVVVSPSDVSSDDENAASHRLDAFQQSVVRELHDRTAGSGSLAPPNNARDESYAARLARATKPARRYSLSARFAVDDVIEHPAFGVGVVLAVHGDRIEVGFADRTRKLACAKR